VNKRGCGYSAILTEAWFISSYTIVSLLKNSLEEVIREKDPVLLSAIKRLVSKEASREPQTSGGRSKRIRNDERA